MMGQNKETALGFYTATQIYVKIIDWNKGDAVNRVDGIFKWDEMSPFSACILPNPLQI